MFWNKEIKNYYNNFEKNGKKSLSDSGKFLDSRTSKFNF